MPYPTGTSSSTSTRVPGAWPTEDDSQDATISDAVSVVTGIDHSTGDDTAVSQTPSQQSYVSSMYHAASYAISRVRAAAATALSRPSHRPYWYNSEHNSSDEQRPRFLSLDDACYIGMSLELPPEPHSLNYLQRNEPMLYGDLVRAYYTSWADFTPQTDPDGILKSWAEPPIWRPGTDKSSRQCSREFRDCEVAGKVKKVLGTFAPFEEQRKRDMESGMEYQRYITRYHPESKTAESYVPG